MNWSVKLDFKTDVAIRLTFKVLTFVGREIANVDPCNEFASEHYNHVSLSLSLYERILRIFNRNRYTQALSYATILIVLQSRVLIFVLTSQCEVLCYCFFAIFKSFYSYEYINLVNILDQRKCRIGEMSRNLTISAMINLLFS